MKEDGIEEKCTATRESKGGLENEPTVRGGLFFPKGVGRHGGRGRGGGGGGGGRHKREVCRWVHKQRCKSTKHAWLA